MPPPLDDLRVRLADILRHGIAEDAVEHAQQVARIAAVLHEAFQRVGLSCTLVGGSAIEVHAPGIYTSGDIDLVIGTWRDARAEASVTEVFGNLGFQRQNRHWAIGRLFVEVPGGYLEDPDELVRAGEAAFRIIKKEVLLADRIVGYKHWGYTGYGQQAIDMLAAFGDDVDLSWLRGRLEREDSYDAYLSLRALAGSDEPVTEETLRALLGTLRNRAR